jgi:hypothetical protein
MAVSREQHPASEHGGKYKGHDQAKPEGEYIRGYLPQNPRRIVRTAVVCRAVKRKSVVGGDEVPKGKGERQPDNEDQD